MARLDTLPIAPRPAPEPRRKGVPADPQKYAVDVRASRIDGRGAFAAEAMPARRKIGEIRGESLSVREARRRAKTMERIMIVELSHTRAIDASGSTDPLRFTNHSCQPNAVLRIRQGRVEFYAMRDIAVGEEITVNYGETHHEGQVALPLRGAGLRGCDLTPRMQTLAVIDFETTGMSPSQGARATEIAAVLVEDGRIVGRFQSLMNSGAWVPPFIEQLTGISNAMLADAPPSRAVMHEVMRFTRGCPLVAHNAAFDRGFWQAEAQRADCEPDAAHAFACTLLLARRLYPEAPNHKLGTLADWHRLPRAGRAHRALADAEVTAQLLLRMQADLRERHAALCEGGVDHALLCTLQRLPRRQMGRLAAG